MQLFLTFLLYLPRARVIYNLDMSIKPVLQIGDPCLKAKNKRVADMNSRAVKQIIGDLKDTMRERELIGMAAPQIGYNWQIFVTEPRKTKSRNLEKGDKLRIYINPKLVFLSRKQSIIYEGCGSVLNGSLFGPVKRPALIVVEAFDENGKKFRLRCDGILARVIQHEQDHLYGIEFTEKIADYRKLMAVEFYRERIKDSPEQLGASRITVLEIESGH